MVLRRINKKRLVNANRIFGGSVTNKNSLDFGIEMANRKSKPFDRMAEITRAMTSGHAFSDGNKRTATVAVTSDLYDLGYKADKKKIVKTMIGLSKTGEGDLDKIKRKLRRCTRR